MDNLHYTLETINSMIYLDFMLYFRRYVDKKNKEYEEQQMEIDKQTQKAKMPKYK